MKRLIPKKKKRNFSVRGSVKISVLFLIITVASYVYLVNSATFDTAKAQKVSNEIAILQSEISELELEYMEKTRAISAQDATIYNLVSNNKESKKIFVSRDAKDRLTLRE